MHDEAIDDVQTHLRQFRPDRLCTPITTHGAVRAIGNYWQLPDQIAVRYVAGMGPLGI